MHFEPIVPGANAGDARALFNTLSIRGDILYRPFETPEAFEAFFLSENANRKPVALGGEGAFAAGCYVPESGKAYITFIGVCPERRRRGVGRAILTALEEALTALSGETRYECSYWNPMNFVWNIPGFPGHDHPNAPGVDVAGSGYLFLKNCGYRDFACQNSYHIDLPDYKFPPDIETLKARLKERGIEITLFDPARHSGLEELVKDLNNPLWKKEIPGNAAKPGGGNPLLIVAQGGKAMGFTGPMAVQPSGRGYFAGIGVHSACRGAGAGKVLFSYLCISLRDMGATFMTLFTGETNPARNIYEAAGFKIVRSWANMCKEK